MRRSRTACFFFFNDTATTEIYTLSLHDALPISRTGQDRERPSSSMAVADLNGGRFLPGTLRLLWLVLRLPVFMFLAILRSEEHTSELQSQSKLVCRLFL